jgi:hypothetical protein
MGLDGVPPESKLEFYKEWKREDSHPDFQYSRKRLEELHLEEKIRFELINKALNGENFSRCPKCRAWYNLYEEIAYCPKCGYQLSRKIPHAVASSKSLMREIAEYEEAEKQRAKATEEKRKEAVSSEGDFHFEKKKLTTYGLPEEERDKPARIGEREPSRLGQLFNVSLRPRQLLLSLKLWFLVFWAIAGLLFLMERNNPTQFYQSVPDPIRYTLYIFASGIGIWSGYRVFEKCDYNPRSDRGIFALRLLAGGIFFVAILSLLFSIFLLGGFSTFLFGGFTEPQWSLGREAASIFLLVLSFTLIILSAYLVFKFERKSGIIVYRR